MRMRRRMLRSKKNHKLIACPADVARADGEDSVTRTRLLQQILDAFLHRMKIVDIFVAGFTNSARKHFARHARNGHFAGRIDIEEHKDVRLIERAAEIVPEMLSAAVTMRLKKHQQAIELATAGCFERRANLDRVMTVIIDDGDAIDHALDVKTAAHSGKLDKALADQVSRNIQVQRDCRSRRRVADVVHPGRMCQPEQPKMFAFVSQPELALQAFQLHIANYEIGLTRSSISNDGTLHTGNDRLHVGLIDAEDRRTVEWHAIHKLNESVLNIFQRCVLVEVFAINGSHYSDYRCKHQEAAIALVRFHHKIFAFAEPRGRARLVDLPANHKRGVKMRCGQHRSDDRSGSRFAMSAGHGDSVFQAHQLRKHFRARNHGNFHLVRFDDFWVIRLHGGGSHDTLRAIGVGGFVTLVDRRAEVLEALGDGGRLSVRAGHGIPKREKYFGDAAHADATNTDEVNPL